MALNRSWFTWTALAVLGLGVGLVAAWFSGAGLVRDGIDGWARDWRDQGNFVTYGEIKVEGFPLAFRSHIAEPVIGRKNGETPWQWRPPKGLTLTVKPWDIDHMVIGLGGLHRVRYTSRHGPRHIAVTAASGRVRLGAGANGANDLDLDARTITAVPAGAGAKDAEGGLAIQQLILIASHQPLAGADHRTPTANVSLGVLGITLPKPGGQGQRRLPLGRRIDTVTLEATVLGPLAGRLGIGDIIKWRDDGGTVDIETLLVHWGPLNFSATGTLALDHDLQPLLAMTATITGFNQTIDALAAARAIKARDADTAKMLLSLLAKRPGGGGPAELKIPLTVQDGKLFVGPVALMKVPRLKWF
ncbi:MAG: DUF2125 domain-containing protein [Alphaproteobacteria bacterium]